MKILTKEEEERHYQATVKGGIVGGIGGTIVGAGAVLLARRRFPQFQALTTPFQAFLAASTGTFSAIIAADRASARYETYNNAERQRVATHKSEYQKYEESKPLLQRSKDWAAENRYSIVFASWVASIGIAFALVRRNPYLTTSQKLVQSRVYAQGLTLAVLLASFGLEAKDAAQNKGRWETIKVVDPSDPLHQRLIEKRIHHERYEGEDQWMEVIAAEERKMKERAAEHEKEVQAVKAATERKQKTSTKA